MTKYAWLICGVAIGFVGCNSNPKKTASPGQTIVSGEKKVVHSVDADIKNQIDVLNRQVFFCLKNNKYESLTWLMSDQLQKREGKVLQKSFNKSQRAFTDTTFYLLDEFELKNADTGKTAQFTSGSGDGEFTFYYRPKSKDNYISLLLTGGADQLLVVNAWGKYGNDWKLDMIHVGTFSIDNKTAPQWYKEALRLSDAGDLVDAADAVGSCSHTADPVPHFFVYKTYKEMGRFYDSIVKKTNQVYKMPVTVNDILTKPTIFNIHAEQTKDGSAPMVYYLTKIKLQDTVNLKIENTQLQGEIGNLFTGIDKQNKVILYGAYNQMPNGHHLAFYRLFTQRTGKP